MWRVLVSNWLFSNDAFVNLVFSYCFLLVSLVGVCFFIEGNCVLELFFNQF